MTVQQLQVLRQLHQVFAEATDCGLFDELQADARYPDSINDVCDVVAFRLAFTDFVSSHIAEFNCVPAEFEFNDTVYTQDEVWSMAQGFGLTKEIRSDQT